jgi:electron transport complex protein RnfE
MTQPDTREVWLQPVGLLALCPLLAVGNTLLTASCMALLFLVSLTFVSVTMAVLGRGIAPDARILTLLLVSGVWVSVLDLCLKAFAFQLSEALGVYVPLVAANSLLLTVGEQSLRGKGAKAQAQVAVRSGLVAASWLLPLGLLREILGTGSLFSDSNLLPGLPGPLVVTAFTVPLLDSAAGALLALALAAAWVKGRARAAPDRA